MAPYSAAQRPQLKPKTYATVPAQAMQDRRLRPSDWRVLTAVSYHADPRGLAWPSQQTIADLTGLSRQTVNKCIKRLVSCGYLKLLPARRRPSGRFSHRVYLLVRKKPDTDRVKDAGDTDHVNSVMTSPCKPRGDTNKPLEQGAPLTGQVLCIQGKRSLEEASRPPRRSQAF